jgi:ABC-type nitrate/sulfonate/bicarbonate transport system ATPase subunit
VPQAGLKPARRSPETGPRETRVHETNVRVDDVSHAYRDRHGGVVQALAGVSLHAAPGELLAVVGASGCGKTTLLELICGLQSPDQGSIACAPAALMPQRDLLLPWLSAVDNAALALRIAGHARASARARLSGKPVLCLDEPFGALDAITRAEMQGWLGRTLAREPRTVVLVTHDVEEAIVLADRVAVLSSRPGRVRTSIDVSLPRPRSRTDAKVIALRERALLALGLDMQGMDAPDPHTPGPGTWSPTDTDGMDTDGTDTQGAT